MPPDRLAAAGVLGGLRQRTWSVLTVCAFLVPAAACAAGPMFAEASANAAFDARRAAVPATARQDDAPVVRLSADTGPKSLDQQSVLTEMRAIPGLRQTTLTGQSVGAEVVRPVFWESTVSVRGKSDRARLYAVENPRSELTAVGRTAPGDGIWLPAPLAGEIGAEPGDELVVTVRFRIDGKPRRTTVPMAGAYAVDGRLPAGRTWALRRFDTPGDTEFRTLASYLLIGDVPTVEKLANALGDQILWSTEATLKPGATLAEAETTARRIEDVRRRYASARTPDGNPDNPLSLRFASGIGRIAAAAEATNHAVAQRTRPVEWAAIVIGLASVLAVVLLSIRRRERELRHAVAVGISPIRVGGLWLLEHFLPAVLGAALGWVVAWQLVVRFGPPGRLVESLAPAGWAAAAATAGGLLTVAGVSGAAAFRRVRPAPPATLRRALPWGLLVVVAAIVAVAGLSGASGTGGGVDLLVPLLVLAAAAVIAGRLTSVRRTSSSAAPRRPAVWLAARRLRSGGAERRVAIVVITTGLGMLLFALSALQSTATSADDRVAVAAGAEGVATLDGSWQLDPQAVLVPEGGPNGEAPPEGPVPGVRTPPLPPGNTVVWRVDATTPLDDTPRDVLLVDPARFREVALWGHGADLAAARAAVALLDRKPGEDDPIPAIAVADPGSAGLDTIAVTVGYSPQVLELVARVPAFPGMQDRPMYVVAAEPVYAKVGPADPRLRPRSGLDQNPLFARTYLWSSAAWTGSSRRRECSRNASRRPRNSGRATCTWPPAGPAATSSPSPATWRCSPS